MGTHNTTLANIAQRAMPHVLMFVLLLKIKRILKMQLTFCVFSKVQRIILSAMWEQRIIFLSGEQPYKQHLIAIPL
jgi:hypothetical protein